MNYELIKVEEGTVEKYRITIEWKREARLFRKEGSGTRVFEGDSSCWYDVEDGEMASSENTMIILALMKKRQFNIHADKEKEDDENYTDWD